MNKIIIRDSLRLSVSLLFSWLYIPHLLIFVVVGRGKSLICSDLSVIEKQVSIKLPIILQLIYQLHNNRYFRNLFYYRIGPVAALFVKWYRPGDKYFLISYKTKIGQSMRFAHPFGTDINAESIGDNFSCLHLTTLGAKGNDRPVIGNNVRLGCNVTIIGPVHIGNNVTIGAGSVVVKNIPDNCVAVGNPCKPIKFITETK